MADGTLPGPPPLPAASTMDDRVSSAVLGMQERDMAAVMERSRCVGGGGSPQHAQGGVLSRVRCVC